MIREGDFNRIGSTKPMIHRVISSFPKTAHISKIRQEIIQTNPAKRDKKFWWPSDHHDVAQQSGQGFVEKDDDDLGVNRDENAHDLGLKIVCDIPWKGGLGYNP